MLTSAALSDLKSIFDQASALRRDLVSEIAGGERDLDQVRRRLKFAKAFIVRLWTRKWVERLSTENWALSHLLDQSKACLEACVVSIDYELSASAAKTHAALIAAHEAAIQCKRIWSVTTEVAAAPIHRTAANTIIGRSAVQFGYGVSALIKSPMRTLRLRAREDCYLLIYPTFVVVEGPDEDQALVSFDDLTVRFAPLRFIETEAVPEDSSVVDRAWKRANKNGGPDKRFRDNYQIPVCLYGELQLQGKSGLDQRFIFSNAAKGEAFATALRAHQEATASLNGSPVAQELGASSSHQMAPPPPPVQPRSFVADWIAVVLLLGFAVEIAANGGSWLGSIQPQTQPAVLSAAPSAPTLAEAPARPPAASPVLARQSSPPSIKPRAARNQRARRPEKQTCVQVLTDPGQSSCQSNAPSPILIPSGRE